MKLWIPIIFVLRTIIFRVSSAKYFQYLQMNTGQFSLCLRYVGGTEIKVWTVFAISVACNTSGHELASSLVEILKSFGIDLTYLWGQGYSGALSLKVPRCTKHQIAINSAGRLCYYASHALNLDNGNTADIRSVWNYIRIMWNFYNVWSTAKMKHCTEWLIEIPQIKVKQN
jgi:hypothetical protein